ncbi:MAG: metal-dependent hydrolase [Candidatus Rokuibacteriota bacterium]
MPTVFSHAAAPLALGLGLGPEIVPRRLLAAGVVASVLPDLDVVAFHLGIPYSADLGHRGLSHSLFFAAVMALVGAAGHRALRAGFPRAYLFLFVAAASHGALDAFTDGGLGVAFLWPWSGERYFAPDAWRVVEVSPIGVSRFLSWRGLAVLGSELRWIWPPALALGLVLFGVRRARGRRERTGRPSPHGGSP